MESEFVFFREIEVEEEDYVKGQVPKRARRRAGPHRIRAGFDRVGEHVDRGMELLPDHESPKVDHKVPRLPAKSVSRSRYHSSPILCPSGVQSLSYFFTKALGKNPPLEKTVKMRALAEDRQ